MSKWLCWGFKRKPVIEYWDCSHLNLVDIPREVFRHRLTLRSLYINSNSIKDVPKSIFLFEELEELDLSENDILFLPPSISKLRGLTSLNLSKNSLSSLPDAIGDCRDLLTLDVSSNPLGMLCDGLTDLKHLTRLVLNDCQLEELPPNIGRMSKLEVLELRENQLHTLPMSLSHLTLLEKLDLGANDFCSVSAVVGSLESLTELWLDANTLGTLPEEIGNLRNLRFLEVSENHLMTLPQSLGNMANLCDLYLHDNLISSLPDSIGRLGNLGLLRLESNRITFLPDTISGCVNLVEVDVSHNHLADLPSSIGCLTKLVNLVLDENLLIEIPPEIGGCSSLKVLALTDNQLSELPAEMGRLERLTVLNVVGNKLNHLPYTLTGLDSLTAIWIAENQSRPIVELQLVRVPPRGEKQLTCFLLPQQGKEEPFEEATSPLDAAADEPRKQLHHKNSQVNFDPKVQDRKSNISRDLTPFPKELHMKAMQWRQNRDLSARSPSASSSGEGRAQGEGGSNGAVELRHHHHHLNPKKATNRYSLLKALDNPLDADNLQPASGRVRWGSRSSSREATPIATITEEPSSSSGLSSKPPTLSPHTLSPHTLSPPNSSTPQQPLSPETPPLSPPRALSYSDDDFIAPPLEFAGSHPPPPSSYSSSSRLKQNGGLLSPLLLAPVADQQTSLPESDQAFLLSNSNGNNSNGGGGGGGGGVGGDGSPGVIVQNGRLLTMGQNGVYYPSQTSTLSHSEAPELRSSMESGFDADTELENQTWYLVSPETSPKSHPRGAPDGKQRLGPNVSTPDDSETASSQRSQGQRNHYDRLVRVPGSGGSYRVKGPPQKQPPVAYGHQTSRSFDAVESLSTRFAEGSHPSHRPTSPPSHNSSSSSTAAQKPKASYTMEKKNGHTRSRSQPEELVNMVSPTHKTPVGGGAVSRGPARHSSRRAHPLDSVALSKGHTHSEAVILTSYPGHRRVLSPNQGGGGGGGGRARHHSDVLRDRVREGRPPLHGSNHHRSQHSYSDESTHSGGGGGGGRLTPETTAKAVWVSGNDSGFDSMRRSEQPLTLSSNVAGGSSHKLTLVEVTLVKNPTLGLGITGGRDGENAINPGDPGFHVYRLVEGLPAAKSGKIAIGDKLLEVDGIDVTQLSSHEVLALLTGPERQLSLLLSREPSVTLL